MSRLKERLKSKFQPHGLDDSITRSRGVTVPKEDNPVRATSCTPASRPGIHARAKPLPRRQELADNHLRFLESRGVIREDRLADLKLLMAKELSFVNKQLLLVDLMESHAIDWAVNLRDLYLPSTVLMVKAWDSYLPNRAIVKSSMEKLTCIIEEALDHLVESTTNAALSVRKLLIDIRGQCHIISEGFRLRDDCFQQLTTCKAKSIVIQMMMSEGQWPSGLEVTREEQQSLDNFIVADRSLRDNLYKFSSHACARSGDIAARTLHFSNLLGTISAQFKQRLDGAAIRFLDATRETRPLIPTLEIHLQEIPPSARTRTSLLESTRSPLDDDMSKSSPFTTPSFPIFYSRDLV